MLKIYFDNIEINGNWVRSLKQSAISFDNQFKLGSTICRAFTLEVDKRANESLPNFVYLKRDNGTTYATLKVDEADDNNNSYRKYSLMDEMVYMNKEFVYDTSVGYTVKQLVEQICANHNILLANTNIYMGDLVVSWTQEGMTERDFISYVAEVNGGYARINESGNLEFVAYSNTIKDIIDVETCSSFKLGTHHLIDRVYVELASATKYYPDSTTNETCYLNSNNILLTDSGSYTIEGIIRHIYDTINGLNFYNIKADRCPLNEELLCGDMISFSLGNETYNTIAQIEWNYAGHWFGGNKLELQSAEQQETQVLSPTKRIGKEIKIIVDRELGSIRQSIDYIEENYATKVSLDLYLKEDEASQKVVSWINASADNIVLNTKKLIFGDLDNQYIEVSNYNDEDIYEYVQAKNDSTYVQTGLQPSNVDVYKIRFMPTDIQTSQDLFGFLWWSREAEFRAYIGNGKLSIDSVEGSCKFNLTENVLYDLYISITDGIATLTEVVSGQEQRYEGALGYHGMWDLPIFLGTYNDGDMPIGQQRSGTFIGKLYSFKAYNSLGNMLANIYGFKNNDQPSLVNSATGTRVVLTQSGEYDGKLAIVGVLFDGTGQIMMKPEGKFRVENFKEGDLYNRIFLDRYNVESYGESNYLSNTNYCYADSNYLANELRFISTINNSSSYHDRNMIMLNNKKYGSNDDANSLTFSSTPTGDSLNIHNYKVGTTTSANNITLHNQPGSFALSNIIFKNNRPDDEYTGNSLELSSSIRNGNQTKITNFDINPIVSQYYSSDAEANYIRFDSKSSSNVVWLVNNKKIYGDTQHFANYIYMSNDDYMNYLELCNYDHDNGKNDLINRIRLSSSGGLSIYNQWSELKMGLDGDTKLMANNTLTLKSDHYNVVIDADNTYKPESGNIYLEYARKLYFNGHEIYMSGGHLMYR